MARRRMSTQTIADLLANSDTDNSDNSDSEITGESSDCDELPPQQSSSDVGWRLVIPIEINFSCLFVRMTARNSFLWSPLGP